MRITVFFVYILSVRLTFVPINLITYFKRVVIIFQNFVSSYTE